MGARSSAKARAALERAKARLDTLDLYQRPVSIARVRLWSVPRLFALPWLRRFDGYALHGLVLLRRPLEQVSDDLVVHELCHVWQMQHHPIRMPLSYVRSGYARNRYEREAGEAARRSSPASPDRL